MKFLNLYFLILAFVFTNTSSSQITPEQMVVNMGRGINIGNVLTAPVEGDWAAPLQETYIQDIAAAGFSTVRIPMDFFGLRASGDTSVYSKNAGTASSYNGTPSDYIVSSIYLDRIEEVISWALNNNLVVILDVHGSTLKEEFLYTFSPKPEHAAYYTNPTSAKRAADNEKFRAIWSAIANRFKDYDYNLLFEVINEPYFFLTDIEMDALNTDIINIIRSTGNNNADRNIIITGGSENAYLAPLQISPSVINSDDNLIATFHYYLPREFTASGEAAHNDYDWGTSADKAEVDNHFEVVQSWSQSNNIPVLLGEFGVDNEGGYNYETNTYGDFGGPENESRIAYYSYLGQKAIDLGFAYTVWDAGRKSNKTIYIENTRTWVNDILDALLDVNTINATNWYVSMTGDDNNNGLSPLTPFRTFSEVQNNVQPGDTVFVMGVYTNDAYNSSYTYSGNTNDPHLWHKENTIRINNMNGALGHYITIKPFNSDTKLKGDGANIFRVTNSSFLIIEDFEIEGEVEQIPLSTANALQFVYIIDDNTLEGTSNAPAVNDIRYRNEDEINDNDNIVEETDIYTDISNEPVSRPSYIDTRGLYVSNSDEIIIRNNIIHDMPGGGLRVSDGSFVDIVNNEIFRCSAKSYTGTHALVVTRTKPVTTETYSIKILGNEVHHNYNEQFSWAPDKTIITPRIDEGKGISLQRNNTDLWVNGSGRILVANNLCYWNGFSGVHSNDGHRIDFINNTCYMNSYTNTVTNAGGEQNGNNIGISSQSGNDIKMINNISVVDTNWNGYALSAGNSVNSVVSDNLIYGINGIVNQDSDISTIQINTLEANPLFVNAGDHLASTYDFSLFPSSPAIDIANTSFAPNNDFFGTLRDAHPDLGAIEYIPAVSTTYTFDGSWTPENPSGISTSNDIINVISGNAGDSANNISDQTIAQSLNISSGAKLVINVGGSLTVQNFDNQGILTIRSNSTSFGTFIPNNIISNGIVEYRRYVNPNDIETGNDLISAPLDGETFGDFVQYQSNENTVFSNPNDTSQKLFGPFDKTTNTYMNYDTDTNDANELLNVGVGYRSGSEPNSGHIFVFTGAMEIGEVDVSIVYTGIDFSPWNLIGNPYTANLDFETFFEANKTQLSQNEFQAVYGYNATLNRWTIWNQLTIDQMTTNKLIVPGQAFFVSSKPDNGLISFTPSMRRAGTSDDFILNRSNSNSNTSWVNLNMNIASNVFNTHIYFVDGKTRGLDLGFDAGVFNGDAEGIFTRLVEDNEDVDIAIQVLPYSDLNSVTVPLGIKVSQGVQFSIGIDSSQSSLPSNTLVYLEDVITNTWTLLNTQDYTITSDSEISGTGRFFIHFQEETLSNPEIGNQNIKLFVDNENTLHIEGYLNQSSSVDIYDLLGKKLVSETLKAHSTNNYVRLNTFSEGIYIVHLNNKSLYITKKILVK
ncbi:cellulase family glycosylhydrolase [Winogradskyella sp.]|nr:cellulase family glycosylhydrolase [Winogradskyella sp.]